MTLADYRRPRRIDLDGEECWQVKVGYGFDSLKHEPAIQVELKTYRTRIPAVLTVVQAQQLRNGLNAALSRIGDIE